MTKKGNLKKNAKRKNQADDVEPEFVCHISPTIEAEAGASQLGPDTLDVQDDGTAIEVQPQDPLPEADASDEPQEKEQPGPKRRRGPTRMKDIAKDPNSKVRVEWTDLGQPCGSGSVTLSSYVGALVREYVPITINDWRKIGDDRRNVMWRSIQARFDLEGDTEKATVMRQMGCIWRSAKSRIVDKFRNAKNNTERMQLRPKNVPIAEWRKFIKQKTSAEFQVISETFKERRSLQIPHTCSRKGMARLAEDLKKESSDPSEVTRFKVWVKSRTKKDGTIVNTNAAQKITKAEELLHADSPTSTSTNPKENMLTRVLGPDNPGRLRAMGRGMSVTKLACFQMRNKYMTEMQKTQASLQKQVEELREQLFHINTQKPEPEIGENSAQRSVNTRKQRRCDLYDYSGGDEKVAEGRILSSDPEDFVNDIPLGPNSVKVLVQTAIIPSAFLWRPAGKLTCIEEAVGEVIAWPQRFDVLHEQGSETEENDPKSPSTNPTNLCKLLDWATTDEEVVCEVPDTFLWRPTAELSTLEDCLKSFVAWPTSRVLFTEDNFETPFQDGPVDQSVPTPLAPTKKAPSTSQSLSEPSTGEHLAQQRTNDAGKENRKCMLMDLNGENIVVAEGRWSSSNPDQKVHFTPLGRHAVCVWVDVVKVNDAAVWRPSSFIEVMEDALGSTLAWPEDKVVMV
ncbi:unnamed protein product [Microthlaspi erraticum]|uniref:DUF8039 domain-containing protein n=1 Tax=Microthlaspi erraticum TaxID=1685480 RepID=A0A6D2HN28_9BRAS|nr:unnamed protein product [Microthlaspi erraticum]